MLILTRKEKQTIVIGEDIQITICRIANGRVKIGLQAPESVQIRRGELPRFEDDSATNAQKRMLVTI